MRSFRENENENLRRGRSLPRRAFSFSFSREIRTLTFGATFASMIAYIIAQFVDVRIFHYLKQKTRGRFLWLRNNVSTITSQMIDSIAVILVTHYYADGIPIKSGEDVHSVLSG